MGSVCGLEELIALREEYRAAGRKVVWTNGCFDLLHAGHLQSLRLAAEFGDILIVGLNADSSVKSLKNPDRPFVNETDRAAVISSLKIVDHVLIFSDKRCDRLLAALQPDIYVKGADYTLETLDQDERRAVESRGGVIKFIPLVQGLSTTNLVKKIRRSDPEKIMSGAFALIRDEQGRLLMVKNNYEGIYKYGIPGGGQNRGETLEEAVIREVEEETGYLVEVCGYLGVIERIEPTWNLHLLCHQFECRVVGGSLKVRENEEHVVEAVFRSPEQIRTLTGEVLGRKHLLRYLADPEGYSNYIFMGEGEE